MRKKFIVDLFDEYIPGSCKKKEPYVFIELYVENNAFVATLHAPKDELYSFLYENMQEFLSYVQQTYTTPKEVAILLEQLQNPQLDIAPSLLKQYSYNEIKKGLQKQNKYNPILNINNSTQFLPRYIFLEEQFKG